VQHHWSVRIGSRHPRKGLPYAQSVVVLNQVSQRHSVLTLSRLQDNCRDSSCNIYGWLNICSEMLRCCHVGKMLSSYFGFEKISLQ
jgi:hypothetical protein